MKNKLYRKRIIFVRHGKSVWNATESQRMGVGKMSAMTKGLIESMSKKNNVKHGGKYMDAPLTTEGVLEAIDLKLDGEEGALKGVDEATHLNTQVREKSHLKLEGSRATLEGSRATLEGEDEATRLNTQVRGKGTNSIVNTCLQDLRSLTAEK